MEFRSPTPDEERLLLWLAERAHLEGASDWSRHLLVRAMRDGGMGSLEFAAPENAASTTGRIVELSSVKFLDSDGVAVVATLNGNEDRTPVELDVWKTDFSPLLGIPLRLDPAFTE